MDSCGKRSGPLSLKPVGLSSGPEEIRWSRLIIGNGGGFSDFYHENLAFFHYDEPSYQGRKMRFYQALPWFFFKDIMRKDCLLISKWV